jgi:hypothetical protein
LGKNKEKLPKWRERETVSFFWTFFKKNVGELEVGVSLMKNGNLRDHFIPNSLQFV